MQREVVAPLVACHVKHELAVVGVDEAAVAIRVGHELVAHGLAHSRVVRLVGKELVRQRAELAVAI